MSLVMFQRSAMCGVALALLACTIGCGDQSGGGDGGAPQAAEESHEGHDHEPGEHEDGEHEDGEQADAGHNLGGFWCSEHGVPEADCSMCSSVAAAKFKEKGDWCEEHDRAESQCFKCDPSRAEKFVKLYVAKTGKQPPKRAE